MSVESAKSFFVRMQTDDEFADKVRACEDVEEIKKLVYEEGYYFSAADVIEAEKEIVEKQ
ncbi:MAG: Nif11-like leader peptide family natural product precursor [Syntrophomonas sp.]|nr:Nif11-like leader peptide family natural product precursor [Syntrophomonas sp.]